jgi:excinuclease UvrABC ATPase subunit
LVHQLKPEIRHYCTHLNGKWSFIFPKTSEEMKVLKTNGATGNNLAMFHRIAIRKMICVTGVSKW